MKSIRCAANTLQLTVDNALKDKSIAELIAKARRVCRKLRTLTIIKRMKLLKPILDCVTLLHSTHGVLERLLVLKNFCHDMTPTIKELRISDSDWTETKNIVNALKPAKITTTIFHRKKLFVEDFYSSWLTCKINTEKVGCRFSNNLVQFMNEREKVLLHNEAILTAILC